MSANMSPYCSAHDEWLIMKLCMYVGYHDTNNVSNFGGDPVAQLNFKNVSEIVYAALRARRTVAVTRSTVFQTAAVCATTRTLQQFGRPSLAMPA